MTSQPTKLPRPLRVGDVIECLDTTTDKPALNVWRIRKETAEAEQPLAAIGPGGRCRGFAANGISKPNVYALRILNDAPPAATWIYTSPFELTEAQRQELADMKAAAAAPTPVITGPGEYRTRGGWKAVIVTEKGETAGNGNYVWHGYVQKRPTGTRISRVWKNDGTHYFGEIDVDIVGPWPAPYPAAAPRDFPLADAIVPEPEAMTTEELYQELSASPSEPFRITGPGWYLGEKGSHIEIVGKTESGLWIGLKGREVKFGCWYDDGSVASSVSIQERLTAPWREPRTAEVSVVVERSGDKVRISTKIVGNKDHGTEGLCLATAENGFDFSSIWGSVTLTGTITENQNHGGGK